jgi:hypothetical protein
MAYRPAGLRTGGTRRRPAPGADAGKAESDLTTEELERRWRLIVLLAVSTVKGGATSAGLQRGLTLIPRDAAWAALHDLERGGLLAQENVPSGHPSGTRVDRWYVAEGVALDFNI